jgi:hypothetical protein
MTRGALCTLPPKPRKIRLRHRAQVIADDITVEAVMTASTITIEPHHTMERRR